MNQWNVGVINLNYKLSHAGLLAALNTINTSRSLTTTTQWTYQKYSEAFHLFTEVVKETERHHLRKPSILALRLLLCGLVVAPAEKAHVWALSLTVHWKKQISHGWVFWEIESIILSHNLILTILTQSWPKLKTISFHLKSIMNIWLYYCFLEFLKNICHIYLWSDECINYYEWFTINNNSYLIIYNN